jgi:hypothetical protein
MGIAPEHLCTVEDDFMVAEGGAGWAVSLSLVSRLGIEQNPARRPPAFKFSPEPDDDFDDSASSIVQRDRQRRGWYHVQ